MNTKKYQLKSLKKNDLVRILCTARSAQRAQLQPAVHFLEEMGLRVDYGDTIGKIHHQFGGTAAERLADFQKAWNDPEVKAIWIARGGYGTIQILDDLDFKRVASTSLSHLKKNRDAGSLSVVEVKPVIGYSDVTLIHNKMQKAGLPSIHAFMPLELNNLTAGATCAERSRSKASFQKALFGENIITEIINTNNLTSAEISGILYGGNLSILYSMLGSNDLPSFHDGILFIEEIDEYLYHLERMLFSLKRAGKLHNLKVLLVGGMTDMNDHEVPFGKNAREIILDVTEEYDYPVIFDVPAGHITDNRTLKMGCEMQILITADRIILKQK
ncbi:MAG: LD-carboxypeptidase [Nonlabens sp.]